MAKKRNAAKRQTRSSAAPDREAAGGEPPVEDRGERERIEDELERQRLLLDSIVENMPNMIFVKDAERLRFVLFNKAGEDLIGFPREQMLGKNDYDFFPKEQADFFTGKDRAVLAHHGVVDIPEEPINTKNRGTRLLHTRKIALRDKDGKALYLLGISEDVTERKEAERLLRRLNGELTAANTDLESFSSSVAHDLRAPLRQIAGFAKLLVDEEGPKLAGEGRRFLDKIQGGARHMGALIDDLLNLARIGRQPLERKNASLDEVVRAAVQEVEPEAKGRDVEWRLGGLGSADCDPGLVRQVFVNLLSNALKYTRPRPKAVIEVGRRGAEEPATYFVRDNGVGFDMKYAPKLFGIFARLHAQDEFEGTGVGLATVQRILRKHGGRIWPAAEPEGGATFFFTLGGV